MRQRNEFEEIVRAIRRGGIDALVVSGEEGEQVLLLQGSEHPYRVLVDNFSDGAATLDGDGNILYVNDRFAEILGLPRDKMIGTRLLDHIRWVGRQELARMVRKGSCGEVALRTDDKPKRTIRFTVSPGKTKVSTGRNVSLIATELTHMVKVTEALKTSEQRLRELSARLLSLQDEERRRIARDLHDITGQTLAVQSMMLSGLLERESGLDPDARKIVSNCANVNQQITDEIRTLSYLLHPPLLEELGLAPAIKWFVQGFSVRSGIDISVDLDPGFPRLSPEAEIALFRIVQESLTNMHRHSGTSRGHVWLRLTDREVVLEIRDFGKGMPPKVLNNKGSKASLGVGILGMRERVRQLAGVLDISSRENHGAVITVLLPLTNEQVTARTAPETSSTASSAARKPPKAPPKAKAAKAGRS